MSKTSSPDPKAVVKSNPPKPDLRGAEDVRILVDAFYAKVQADPLLSPVFNDVAKIDWEHHLPVMYQFWESLLFRSGGYEGNPYLKHVPLPIRPEHFQRWLSLFLGTVEELYAGEKADEARKFANNIAGVFQNRMGLVKPSGFL
jgi:hemoglobin